MDEEYPFEEEGYLQVHTERCPNCRGTITAFNLVINYKRGTLACPHCGYIIDRFAPKEDEDE